MGLGPTRRGDADAAVAALLRGLQVSNLSDGWIRHGRARLNLAFRWSTRANQVLSRGGAARGPLRLTAAGLSAAGDAALARRLRRSEHPDLLLHWIADVADLVLWSALASDGSYDQASAATNPGAPLVIETAARRGSVALVLPVANAAVAAAVHRLRGRRSSPSVFAWQAVSVATGSGFAAYAQRRRLAALDLYRRRLDSDLARAELAARNELVVGAGNVFDELQRALILVRLGAGTSASNVVGAAKSELADDTRRANMYLADALVRWQYRHNQLPDLRRVVRLDIDPAIGSIVVSSSAVARLDAALDALDLRGSVPVVAGEVRHGRVVRLVVAGHDVPVEDEPLPVELHFDPVPGGFLWAGALLAVAGLRDDVPVAAAVGPALAAVALSRWAHRAGARPGGVSRPAAVAWSTALTAAGAVVQTVAMRTGHDGAGLSRVPAGLALRGHAFAVGVSFRELTARQRNLVVASTAAIGAFAYALSPAPRQPRQFAAELCWVAMALSMSDTFVASIEADADELEADARDAVAVLLEDARASGVATVLREAEEAYAGVERVLADLGHRLDPALRDEAERRLRACRALLDAVTAEHEA